MRINSKYKAQNARFSEQCSVTETRKNLFIIFILLLCAFCSLPTINAQKRDNLTLEEDELVREAQQIDQRMEIFVRVIDRRFLALTGVNSAQSKQAEKDSDKWGALRTGTRTQLFFDIEKTLDEAIGKINDIAERDKKNPLFQKAVHILAEAGGRWLPQLKSFQEKDGEEREKALLYNIIDLVEQVIEASATVPKEEKKKKN